MQFMTYSTSGLNSPWPAGSRQNCELAALMSPTPSSPFMKMNRERKFLYAAQYMCKIQVGSQLRRRTFGAPQLAFAFATRTITAVDSKSLGMEDPDYVKGEGSFEEKTDREGRTGTRSRWIDFLTGRRCLCCGGTDTGYATESADCGS
jgi:hypothetical protein